MVNFWKPAGAKVGKYDLIRRFIQSIAGAEWEWLLDKGFSETELSIS